MKTVNYIMQGFGFLSLDTFKISAFGFMTSKIFNIAFLIAVVNTVFGFNHVFLFAYSLLIVFEWFTGVRASLKRGEKHESRKLGRMILKLGVYSLPIYVLNTFNKNANFPTVFGYELDPFLWLYWTVLLVIIWQLLISLLENLDCLGFRWAGVALKIINKRFYKQFDLDNESTQ